ncbi:hypothetical protein FOZ61_006149 [Perkinsus olseni]|uniref:Uncharacterized protein n=2 Tax=Perkinsus olseni TaxID=32597 RepID=A0A7J6LEJ0_PEROL|nr:hypothetical protein FOZ61_006149 [Perkinsus olseni]
MQPMSLSSSFAEAPTLKKPVSCTGGDGLPLSFIDEDTIVYADEPEIDDPNLKIMALKQRIDVLEEEKKWLEWRLRKWQDCHKCSKCKHEKQEEKEDEAVVVKSSARIMEVSSHGSRMTRHQSRSYIYSWIHCNDMDLPDGVLKKRLSRVLAQLNEAKSLTFYSIFIGQQQKDGSRLVHSLLKYGTPTRWKQLSDTLRSRYGIDASIRCAVPRPGFKSCMYPMLFSHCLDLDPSPFLSPHHPDPESLLDVERQCSKGRQTLALEGGDLSMLPIKRDAERKDGIPEHAGEDRALAVSVLGDSRAFMDESVDCMEEDNTDPMYEVEACLEAECICESPALWLERISSLVVRNLGEGGAKKLRNDIQRNLDEGRSKETNVVIYGVASSGKTAILRPLTHILKCAKISDAEEISHEDLLDCECILWSHFSVEDLHDNFDMTKLLKLLDDRPVEMSCSSDLGNTGSTFDKLVPIFLTCDALPVPREDHYREALHERLQRCYYFPRKMDHEERVKPFRPCNRCFADWLFADRLARTQHE